MSFFVDFQCSSTYSKEKPIIWNLKKKYFYSDYTRPFWDPFQYIYLFIYFKKHFSDKYLIITYFGSFPYLLFYYLWKTQKRIWMRIQKRHTYVLPRTSFKSSWLSTLFGSVYLETCLWKVSCLIKILLERIYFSFRPKTLWQSRIRCI